MFTMLWLVRWKLLIRTRYNLFPHCRTSTATSVNSQLVVFMAEKWIFLGKTKLILSAPLIVMTMVKCKVFWGYFIRKLGGEKRGECSRSLVNNMSNRQARKNIKFWVLRWTKSQIIKKFSFLFKVKRYDRPCKGINWMEIISVHFFFANVISKTAKTFVSQKQWLWLRWDKREQQNELSCIHYISWVKYAGMRGNSEMR